MNINGIYLAYMSSESYGVVMLVFKNGHIIGVDTAGVKFDGGYAQDETTGGFLGKVYVSAPPNIDLVQGLNTGQDGLRYEVALKMPRNFLEIPFLHIETPFGPVNAKLEKLRDLGELE